MAKRSRSGASYKAQYSAYKLENRWKKNKIAKLERRVLKNENDTGAVEALKKVINNDYMYSRNRRKGSNICKSVGLSLIPGKPIVTPPTPADQLFELGLINDKRRTTTNARLDRVYKR